MTEIIKLSDIKIMESFSNTIPNKEKMCECREFWRWERKQDRPIILNRDNVLIDGYIIYLILQEHKEEYAEITYKNKHAKLPKTKPSYKNTLTTYIHGTHLNSNCTKEFMWRIPKSWTWMADNVQIGDMLLCGTKFGAAPVVVTKIETLDKCPTDLAVKKVVGKNIMRNGAVVEW